MNLQWVLAWWNLLYILPATIAVAWLGAYVLTGVGGHDGDHDAAGHGDHDGDAGDGHAGDDGHGVDHAGHGHSHDGHHDGASGGGAAKAVLNLLGVGKVPTSLLGVIVLMSFGVIGFGVNKLMLGRGEQGMGVLAVSLPIALPGALILGRVVASLIGRYAPLSQSSARRRHALLGLQGEAIFEITREFGKAIVRDTLGNRHEVACRSSAVIPKGAAVVLVGYDAQTQIFDVVIPEQQ